MHDTSILVQVFQRLGDLHDDMSRQVLAKVGQANDLVKQFATGTELQDDVVVLAGFGEVDELDDIGVIELTHDLHLFEDVGSLGWDMTSA
jgi:hypothetical protein